LIKALCACVTLLGLALAAGTACAVPDPSDVGTPAVAPLPAPAPPLLGPLPEDFHPFGPPLSDFRVFGPPLPSGPEPLGPPEDELVEVSRLLPGQSTPFIWPTVGAPSALAGPPTPAEEDLRPLAGPPLPDNIALPLGPPVPASGIPTAYGFVWPVGSEDAYQQPDEDGNPGFRVVRGFVPGARRGDRHMGVDLSNRQSGSLVRAIGDGIVALVSDRSQGNRTHTGWGNMVVLAHKLPGGEVVYSLLAHLKDRSIRVRAGDRVVAGQPIAEVGSTGHSDGPHLHLELRRYLNWDALDLLPQGWQHVGFLNPLGFLASHLISFPDLPANHWAYPYVMPLVRMGVLHAGPSFIPDQSVSVSEFGDMVNRAFGPQDAARSRAPVARRDDQPLTLSLALSWLQRAILPPQAPGDVDARNRRILMQSLQQATGRPAADLNRELTRAEAAVLLKAALGADNQEPACLGGKPEPPAGH